MRIDAKEVAARVLSSHLESNMKDNAGFQLVGIDSYPDAFRPAGAEC